MIYFLINSLGSPNNDRVEKLALSALHIEGRKPRQALGTDLAQSQPLITSWGARGKPAATLGGPIRKGVK